MRTATLALVLALAGAATAQELAAFTKAAGLAGITGPNGLIPELDLRVLLTVVYTTSQVCASVSDVGTVPRPAAQRGQGCCLASWPFLLSYRMLFLVGRDAGCLSGFGMAWCRVARATFHQPNLTPIPCVLSVCVTHVCVSLSSSGAGHRINHAHVSQRPARVVSTAAQRRLARRRHTSGDEPRKVL